MEAGGTRGSQEEKGKGPGWAPKHLLGTCCVPGALEKLCPDKEDSGRGHTHASTRSVEQPPPPRGGLLRSSFSEPHNSLPAFVPWPPPACPPPRVSVLSSCLFPEESGASNQTLGKQFFNLQLQTLILPKLIL